MNLRIFSVDGAHVYGMLVMHGKLVSGSALRYLQWAESPGRHERCRAKDEGLAILRLNRLVPHA